uniref:MFS domain-containing protein n=2 Tax=Macrostomum lignano TaxID=282301 RepID=A0A1I8GZD2_9PLAT
QFYFQPGHADAATRGAEGPAPKSAPVEDGVEEADASNTDGSRSMEFVVVTTDNDGGSALDGGYGWAVVGAAFMVNLLADGITFSFGLLLTELFNSLGDSREQLAWISSLLCGAPLLLGPVTSVLVDRFGCRRVCMAGGLLSGAGFAVVFAGPPSRLLVVLSAGLVSGLGLGLCYMPAVTSVSYYFRRRRALATGISVSGSGVGTLLFAYITGACLNTYGWRGSFLLLGGLLFNLCACGALLRPLAPRLKRTRLRLDKANQAESRHNVELRLDNSGNRGELSLARRHLFLLSRGSAAGSAVEKSVNNAECNQIDDIESSITDRTEGQIAKLAHLLRRPVYLLLLASNFLLYFWYNITYYFLPDHATELGFSSQQSELVIAIVGVSNAVGQIAIGVIADHPRVNATLLYSLCIGLAGLSNSLIPLCASLSALIVYGLSFGFLISANFALGSILLIDRFGLERFTSAYGVMLFVQGLASLFGPPAIGYMRDSDANYNRAFVYSGIFIAASALLIVPSYFRFCLLARLSCSCCCWGRHLSSSSIAISSAVARTPNSKQSSQSVEPELKSAESEHL